MRNPLTPAGIEPATFRFVAQHLNHCATAVPTLHEDLCKFIVSILILGRMRMFQTRVVGEKIKYTFYVQ